MAVADEVRKLCRSKVLAPSRAVGLIPVCLIVIERLNDEVLVEVIIISFSVQQSEAQTWTD